MKKYRVPALDEKLTNSRLLQEARTMDRVRKLGVATPGIYLVDQKERKIYMEHLHDAITVKSFLREFNSFEHPRKEKLFQLTDTLVVLKDLAE